MRNWIIDTLLCLGFLCRTLFPNFVQAHYFECASALYLTFIIGLLLFGILFALLCPKDIKKQMSPKTDLQRFLREVRNSTVALVAIFTGHYIIGVTFLLSFWIFDGLLENIRGAKK